MIDKSRNGKRLSVFMFLLSCCLLTVFDLILYNKPSAAELANRAFTKCDSLAADGNDPNRVSAPVSSESFAPGQAIAACREAVRLNPDNATSQFELGRSLWVAHQDGEAFKYFVDSATQNYHIAEKYIGDAFYEQRLPPEVAPDLAQAVKWYKKADNAGIVSAHAGLVSATETLRKNRFDLQRDGAQFQAPEYLAALWSGDLASVPSPMGLAYYAQGLVKQLDSDPALFMDQTCKPLVNNVGTIAIDWGQAIVIVKLILDAQHLSDDERNARLLRAGADYLAGDQWESRGERDGVVLFNKDIYGCDSGVVKQVMNNIMLKINVGAGNTISVGNTSNDPMILNAASSDTQSQSQPAEDTN